MVQLTPTGMVVTADRAELGRQQAAFAQQHCVRLRGFLSEDLLPRTLAGVRAAEYIERVHQGTGIVPPPRDRKMQPNSTLGLLHFVMSDPQLRRFIEELTGEHGLGNFAGNVYEISPTANHFDTWHDDCSDRRRVALSVNLSNGIYQGGLLQVRDRTTEAVLCEVANTGVGDAILFRIAPGLQHRVSALEGTIPRTAFAGWFHSAQ